MLTIIVVKYYIFYWKVSSKKQINSIKYIKMWIALMDQFIVLMRKRHKDNLPNSSFQGLTDSALFNYHVWNLTY